MPKVKLAVLPADTSPRAALKQALGDEAHAVAVRLPQGDLRILTLAALLKASRNTEGRLAPLGALAAEYGIHPPPALFGLGAAFSRNTVTVDASLMAALGSAVATYLVCTEDDTHVWDDDGATTCFLDGAPVDRVPV